MTLVPTHGLEEASATWVPFTDIVRLLTKPESGAYEDLSQLLGNVVLFVPLGWLLPAIWLRLRSVSSVIAIGAVISLAIEVSQLFIDGRWTSIDDVLLNSLGAAIGAAMFLAPRRI